MASNVDCKQNEATCSKKNITQSIRHILILLFSAAQGP